MLWKNITKKKDDQFYSDKLCKNKNSEKKNS